MTRRRTDDQRCRFPGVELRGSGRPGCRRAFSLLELVVVAALLVVLASIVVPSVSTMGRRGVLMTASGDVLRFVAESQRKAVDSGQRRWLRYEVLGATLITGVDGGPVDTEFAVPEGCEFGEHESAERLPDEVADSLSTEQRQAAWSPEISLFPDGTAEDASWTLKDPAGRARTVSIRGLTGRARVVTGGREQ